jgi:hypothetical protein
MKRNIFTDVEPLRKYQKKRFTYTPHSGSCHMTKKSALNYQHPSFFIIIIINAFSFIVPLPHASK